MARRASLVFSILATFALASACKSSSDHPPPRTDDGGTTTMDGSPPRTDGGGTRTDGPTGSGCTSATTCDDCTGMATCGFCGATGSCHEGSSDGPTDGTTCASEWAWVTGECPGEGDCPTATTCDDCTAMSTCGFCGATSMCLRGTGDGPSHSTCASGWAWIGTECGGAADAGP